MRILFYKSIVGLLLLLSTTVTQGQMGRFQQHVDYQMEVSMDVQTNQYQGKQTLIYSNNSPDTLHRIFYHLYFNAFQPGSMMDVRSRTIADPDRRVGSRIANLSPEEYGYLHVQNLLVNGESAQIREVGTILEVDLPAPILPNSQTTLELDFEGQVPVQIRRSGRDSEEGVRYSMSQWYPKLANYDEQGWHANPYIGREFYGIWGDFDVKITIDKSYVLGGTGYVQNPDEVGHGYQDAGVPAPKHSGSTLTWHFKAPMVHDFMWAADPQYQHDKIVMDNGIVVHHLFIPGEKTNENWEKLKEFTPKAIEYMSSNFGQYPYKQFSVIQGGDGGMEYPMSTLITGERTLPSLVGVMVHELAHSWYHGVLATNESLYPWMDEGFTSFATNLTMQELFPMQGSRNPHAGSYRGYVGLALSGLEEPMSTHSDHYHTNRAYGTAAYAKGAVFMEQLGYIIGAEVRDKALMRYFETWKFKHPNVNDLIRVMEKESGLELDWYKEYFVYTTKRINYSVKEVNAIGDRTEIVLQRKELMPMPIDVVITYTDGSQESVYLPLQIMRGEKAEETGFPKRIYSEDWAWVDAEKRIVLDRNLKQIAAIEIDPSRRMADVDVEDNRIEF